MLFTKISIEYIEGNRKLSVGSRNQPMKQCNNITIKQSNVGAALVITLIVVTVISAIAFSVSRMLVSEVKQITRLEDSEMAYQAAESGIEAGLLLYRA